jgi:hypothetical protein
MDDEHQGSVMTVWTDERDGDWLEPWRMVRRWMGRMERWMVRNVHMICDMFEG